MSAVAILQDMARHGGAHALTLTACYSTTGSQVEVSNELGSRDD